MDAATVTAVDPAALPNDCRRGLAGPPAASIDLIELWDRCPRGMTWATAAMLSARFPVVTPAGPLPHDTEGCERLPDAQLVDGGYAEGPASAPWPTSRRR